MRFDRLVEAFCTVALSAEIADVLLFIAVVLLEMDVALLAIDAPKLEEAFSSIPEI